MQSSLIKEMDNKLGVMVEDLVNEVKRYNMQNSELKELFQEEHNKILANRK
jgi:hypothetical protein